MTLYNIVEEATENYEAIKPVIERLRANGIKKELLMRNASNIVVMYPSKQDLDTFKTTKYGSLKFLGINTLYVHIPFCTSICSYCDFARTASASNDTRIVKYLELLAREASLLVSLYGAKIPVVSIYIGGGTPTLLSESSMQKLFDIIINNFTLISGGEFTLEGSPETVSVNKIMLAKTYGVNRVSLGAESFNDNILSSMRRTTDSNGILKAINNVRIAGIRHIDIDLIRGYPGYTVESVLSDLDGVRIADTPSVTSYQYAVKPKAIDKKRFSNMKFVDDQQTFLHILFLTGMKRLGYQHQSPLVDWFVKGQNSEYKQQLQKWLDMVNLIGIGVGSYGYVDGLQYINFEKYSDYEQSILSDHLPIDKASELTKNEIMHRRMIFGLKGYIDREQFKLAYGVDVLEAPFKYTLHSLIEAGGIDLTENAVRLSDAGMLFADWIQMEFYSDFYKYREMKRTKTP